MLECTERGTFCSVVTGRGILEVMRSGEGVKLAGTGGRKGIVGRGAA